MRLGMFSTSVFLTILIGEGGSYVQNIIYSGKYGICIV
jgi:hypothetical protein